MFLIYIFSNGFILSDINIYYYYYYLHFRAKTHKIDELYIFLATSNGRLFYTTYDKTKSKV